MNTENKLLLDRYPLAGYCSEDYYEARQKFLEAAKSCPHVESIDHIPISTTGYEAQELGIDIAWMGSLDAKNILIHISGTHGVEGHAGSGIQRNLLEEPLDLDKDTAIIFVHGLNPYGMAVHRRFTENNVNLNRNFTDVRKTPPLYERIDSLMNPKEPRCVDFFHLRLLWNVLWYGWDEIQKTLASGQYDFPEGLFYGGEEIEEGPKHLLEWFEDKFSSAEYEDVRFAILDVHSGLGAYAEDIIMTPSAPSEKMVSIFGDRIKPTSQKKTAGYKPTGVFVAALSDRIQKVTQCGQENILAIGQEFGTVSMYQVTMALRNENTAHNYAKRNGRELDPMSPERQKLLRVFYPLEKEWRHLVVERGRRLAEDSIRYLKQN